MKHLTLATTIAAATLAGPALAEQYVCQMEQVIGFDRYNSGDWNFKIFTTRYSYLVNTETATVSQFGDAQDMGETTCDPMNDGVSDYWMCENSINTMNFTFNETLKRFTMGITFGYASGDDTRYTTPVLAIGTCAELGS